MCSSMRQCQWKLLERLLDRNDPVVSRRWMQLISFDLNITEAVHEPKRFLGSLNPVRISDQQIN